MEQVQTQAPDLREDTTYRLKRFMSREERDGQYIVTDGGTFLISGNESFVRFLEKIKNVPFTINQISDALGEKGLGLIGAGSVLVTGGRRRHMSKREKREHRA